MKRYYLWLLVIFFCLATGYEILCSWRGRILSQQGFSKESLLQAAQADPDNPDPFRKLGFLHQWNLLQVDLKESDQYFRKASERNPLEQEYWLNLAKVFQRMGEKGAFERALENAILVFPTGYQGRWTAGNLFLLQGSVEEALPHFSYILTHYPNQSGLVYDVWENVVDPDFIFERLVPKDPSSLNQYLTYLYETGDKESAKKVWGKRVSLGYKIERSETLRHIDFFISQGEINEAFQVWKTRLQEEGLPVPSETNLITNGGFEEEKVLGGGFDWRMGTVAGAEISIDHSVSFEGKSSLKITFNGKENVDFQQVYQFVPLKPDTDYLLRALMKTKAVTTKSGLKMEVSGIGPAFYGASDSLTGDNEWKELLVVFRTPAQSQGGLIRVRREKSNKFDRLISGVVWIDDVWLAEKALGN